MTTRLYSVNYEKMSEILGGNVLNLKDSVVKKLNKEGLELEIIDSEPSFDHYLTHIGVSLDVDPKKISSAVVSTAHDIFKNPDQYVDEPSIGDIVAYFQEEKGVNQEYGCHLVHAGIYKAPDMVESLWGGKLVHHNIEAVPPIFGNKAFIVSQDTFKDYMQKNEKKE